VPQTGLPSRASVVVVGGGVIGLSTAYHLARAGVRDVVLLERDTFGSGSTCKAAGGVRAQFSDAVNIELGARSLQAFETFGATFGQEIDLQQVGYLFLLETPEQVETFEKNIALQNELGVPSRLIEVAEAQALSPLISTEGLLAAAYSPTDGHCTPESVVAGYAGGRTARGRTSGPRLHGHRDRLPGGNDHPCRHGAGVDRDRHGHLRRGAPGPGAWVPWSASTSPSSRCGARSSPRRRCPAWIRRRPFTIDFTTSFYFHGEGQGPAPGHVRPPRDPWLPARTRPTSGWPGLGDAIQRRAPAIR
jgi:sarcosine oxidase subunit beta